MKSICFLILKGALSISNNSTFISFVKGRFFVIQNEKSSKQNDKKVIVQGAQTFESPEKA